MKRTSFLLLGLLTFAGCTYVNTPVLNQADLTAVNFTELKNQKTNTSCQTHIFVFPVSTKKSVAKAAWEANISKVSYVEHSALSVPLLFNQECVVVYGE